MFIVLLAMESVHTLQLYRFGRENLVQQNGWFNYPVIQISGSYRIITLKEHTSVVIKYDIKYSSIYITITL